MRSTRRWMVLAAVNAIVALVAIVTAAGNSNAAPACGDVNASGSVTTADALAVLRDAVGQPVQLECAPPAQPLKTGDATSHGPKSDGFLQLGTARSFTDNGDGTITDDATGLMWEKKDNSGAIHDKDNEYTWSTGTGDMNGTIVTTFLASLNASGGFAGHTDWRVPNRFELETLLNLGTEVPSTYPAFATSCPTDCTTLTCSCTRSGNYWSSTTFQSDTTGAWVVRFDNSDVTAILKTETLHARAVRAGQ